MLLDSNKLNFVLTPNQSIPKEGPKVIPLILDFSGAGDADGNVTFDLDGQNIGSRGLFAMIQTIWVDLSNQANNVTIIINGSGQRLVAKANTQGYYNVMVPNPWKIRFVSAAAGNINVPVFLANVAIPGAVWPTA